MCLPNNAKALPRDDPGTPGGIDPVGRRRKTPLDASAALMMASMLRPAEACPKYGEIIDCGDYGVYAALHNVAGGERIASMKLRSAYRQIVLPKYAMDIVRECRKAPQKTGDTATVRSMTHMWPIIPRISTVLLTTLGYQQVCQNKLELLGYNSTYWCGMELVAQTEPDADERGNAPTAYLLRRSGCTCLCNCTSAPLPDGRSVMPHGLVDALMGHRLRGEDAWWAEWIRREDNWPIIAQVLEGHYPDPNHSAHPAYALAASNSSPQGCHAAQKYIVPADTPPGSTVTVTIRCHDHDRANMRLPGHIQVAGRMRSSLSPQQSTMPDIQEKITEEYYNTLKEDAQKIYRKAKEIR